MQSELLLHSPSLLSSWKCKGGGGALIANDIDCKTSRNTDDATPKERLFVSIRCSTRSTRSDSYMDKVHVDLQIFFQ